MPGISVQTFLDNNWFLVFFIYGLAYFLMGFAIVFEARHPSTLRLGRFLWLLAGFGLLHGTSEWIYVFYRPNLEAGGWETLAEAVLGKGHAVLITLSFVFLLAFGLNILSNTLRWRRWLNSLPLVLFMLWVGVFILYLPWKSSFPEWKGLAEVTSRYLLALPGSVLTAAGLYMQRLEIRGLGHPPLQRALLGASAAFALYAFVGGMVVPYAPFFPANYINSGVFLKIDLPIQLLRTIAGIFMAFFMLRSLDLFEIESKKELEELRHRELIWLEKDRIRRDLHDGVVQSIYGLSLGLDHASKLLRNDPAACEKKLEELRGKTDTLIARFRSYLQELKPSRLLPETVLAIVEDLVANFSAITGLTPDLKVRGDQEKKMASIQRDHLYHMTAEIFSNISRHAEADEVEVDLDLGPKGVRLVIRDNGMGFIPAAKDPEDMGLDNLRVRAARAGGSVRLKSNPGKGTEVSLWLPYQIPGKGENV